MIFASFLNPPKAKSSCSGNRTEPIYKERYEENGVRYLVKTGDRNIYDEIQSHKNEADIKNLIARYTAGDMIIIDKMSHLEYGDTTKMPKTYMDMYNRLNDMKESFYALPLEIREKFDNDFAKYAAEAGTEKWINKMGIKNNDANNKNNDSNNKNNDANNANSVTDKNNEVK